METRRMLWCPMCRSYDCMIVGGDGRYHEVVEGEVLSAVDEELGPFPPELNHDHYEGEYVGLFQQQPMLIGTGAHELLEEMTGAREKRMDVMDTPETRKALRKMGFDV